MSEAFTEILEAAERAAAGSEADKRALARLLDGTELAGLGPPWDRTYLAVLLDWTGMREHAMLALRPGEDEQGDHEAGMRNLAGMLVSGHGEYQSARQLFAQALSASDAGAGLQAKILANLAALNLIDDDLESSSLWLGRAYALQEHSDDPATAVLLASTAFAIARRSGDSIGMRSAVSRLNGATRARIAELGADHPLALGTVASLAAAEFDLASAEESAENQERAIAVLEVAAHRLSADLGANHPRALICLEDLCVADYFIARATGARDRASRAAEMLQSVSRRTTDALGEGHPQARAAAANAAVAARELQEAWPLTRHVARGNLHSAQENDADGWSLEAHDQAPPAPQTTRKRVAGRESDSKRATVDDQTATGNIIPPSPRRGGAGAADIVIWGTPGAGKTTFLGVLDIALNRRDYGLTMTGANDASVNVLIEMTETINDNREFPPATDSVDTFRWDLFAGLSQPWGPAKVTLKLADPSGELMKNTRRSDPNRKKLIDDIVDSAGILFMFDPIREFERGDAFRAANGLLKQLMWAYSNNGQTTFTGRLPHYVAVCITKFDEPQILETARALNILRRDPKDPYGLPWVHNNDARWLLDSLAQVSDSGDGEMTVNTLTTHFYPERVQYFVTSAVGFYVDPRTKKFDVDDPQNLVKDKAGLAAAPRIRGPVRPINIVEPVMWLSERINGSRN
jgi:hypothetical protein